MNTHQFYKIKEVMKISEAMDTPYEQQTDKQQKLLFEIFAKKMKVLQ